MDSCPSLTPDFRWVLPLINPIDSGCGDSVPSARCPARGKLTYPRMVRSSRGSSRRWWSTNVPPCPVTHARSSPPAQRSCDAARVVQVRANPPRGGGLGLIEVEIWEGGLSAFGRNHRQPRRAHEPVAPRGEQASSPTSPSNVAEAPAAKHPGAPRHGQQPR